MKHNAILALSSIGAAALGLAGCTAVPQASSGQMTRAPQAQAPQIASFAHPEERQCLSELAGAGARFSPLPDRYTGDACSNIGTVQLTGLKADYSDLALSNIGPVKCDVGTAFAAWARFGADRAARQILGAGLARIETFGSYSCRNVAGTARRSAHATAGAIDVAGFVLEDGRRITVASDWNGGTAAERQFLRVVQQSACRRFSTVLGPDYNSAHRDHFHVEGVIDGSSYCR